MKWALVILFLYTNKVAILEYPDEASCEAMRDNYTQMYIAIEHSAWGARVPMLYCGQVSGIYDGQGGIASGRPAQPGQQR